MEQIIPIFIPDDRDQISSHPPTPGQYAQASLMASLGVRPSVMAIFFDISLVDLTQTCGLQIEAAAQNANKAVLATLQDMALSGRHPSATLFWVKTFCSHLAATPKDKNTERDTGRVEFTVYCNDGEPNHDY